MMRRLVALGAVAVLLTTLATPSWAQPKFKITPTVSSAEKGKVFEILLRIETAQRLDSLLVVPVAPENFCIRAAPLAELAGYRTNGDGSAFLASLPSGSAVTLQFRVAAPTQLKAQGTSCARLDGARPDTNAWRSQDNTRDTRQFVFNAQYRMPGTDSLPHMWSDTVEVKYTTSETIFLTAGFIGVILGYLVKSLTARKDEVDAARKVSTTWYGQTGRLLQYVFGTNIDKFLTSLVLGLGALLALAKSGIPVGGSTAAMALGITLGLLADDALIARVGK